MEWFRLTPAALMILPSALLALMIAVAGLLAYREQRTEWPLVGFFVGGTAFLVLLLLEFAVYAPWKIHVVLAQYLCVVVALACLTLWAYRLAPLAQQWERRVALGLSTLACTATLYLCGYHLQDWQTRSATRLTPYGTSVLALQVMMVIITCQLVWIIVVFTRQARSISAAAGQGGWPALLRPREATARMARNFALVMSLMIITSLATFVNSDDRARSVFLAILSGSLLLFLYALTITYLRSPFAPTSMMFVRLATALLVTLALCTAVVATGTANVEAIYKAARQAEVEQVRHRLATAGVGAPLDLAVPDSIAFIVAIEPFLRPVLLRDQALPLVLVQREYLVMVERRTQRRAAELRILNPEIDADHARSLARQTLQREEIGGPGTLSSFHLGTGQQQYFSYSVALPDGLYLIGFRFASYREALHRQLVPYALLMIGAAGAVVLGYSVVALRGQHRAVRQPRGFS